MGCCLGTTAAAVNQRQPPAFEEETVKEVLSETPIIVPKTPPQPITQNDAVLTKNPTQITPQNAVVLTKKPPQPITQNAVLLTKIPQPEIIQENVSDVSEMYTYSESFSAATTATTVADTKRDEIDDGEVTQKLKNVSPPAPGKRVVRKRPAGEIAGGRERVTRPPARKQTGPSPERRRQSPARGVVNGQRNRNVGNSGDSRRSRSPAVRGEMGQRRPKVREVDKSSEVVAVKAVQSEETSMVDDGCVSPEIKETESLENPLVSLECFIFL
uniref:uncharacterized protein LOC122596932 n=1 Tax=Erigeron canadensis TaxID=72917 RepID=UPI001CB8C857|nr:uncharacterized protein LOC122596932 [Erigeron canadensis]